MEEIQKQIANIVSELMPQLCALSDEIFDYAEPGYEEYRSSAALTKWLRAHDFEVTIPYGFLCRVPPQGRAGCRRARSRIFRGI